MRASPPASETSSNCRQLLDDALGSPRVHLTLRFVRKGFDAGKFFSSEKFERRTAAGGNMGYLRRNSRLLDGSNGIAASDNRCRARFCGRRNRVRDAEGALRECRLLEHSEWAVPYHGTRRGNFPAKLVNGLWADIKTHPTVGRVRDVGDAGGRRVRRFRQNVIDRQEQPEIAALRFGEQVSREVELVVFN